MFDFLFGQKSGEKEQAEKEEAKKKTSAAGTNIKYDPNLIAELKADHGLLIDLFKGLVITTEKRNEQMLTEQLHEFGNKLRGHLLKENVRFYVYLRASLQADESSMSIMHDFAHEMQQIGRAVTDFLNKYTSIPHWDESHWTVFEHDLNAVGKVLVQRIESEEGSLYTLYLPPNEYSWVPLI